MANKKTTRVRQFLVFEDDGVQGRQFSKLSEAKKAAKEYAGEEDGTFVVYQSVTCFRRSEVHEFPAK